MDARSVGRVCRIDSASEGEGVNFANRAIMPVLQATDLAHAHERYAGFDRDVCIGEGQVLQTGARALCEEPDIVGRKLLECAPKGCGRFPHAGLSGGGGPNSFAGPLHIDANVARLRSPSSIAGFLFT